MAVYFKFKSAKDYDSIPIDGHFISVANLKEKIFESKHLGRGTDFDLVVSNAQTNEEYIDEAMLVPKNTSVLVRRVPGRPRMPIVTERDEPKVSENQTDNTSQPKNSLQLADSSLLKFPEESEWDEFGNDLYAIPEVLQVQSNQVQETLPNRADEDSKIKALIDTPALDWQRQAQESYGAGRGFGRGMGGRMMPGRGFGGRVGMERKNPPQGYICHRCKVPGHFIQHCPTNGDPTYDIRRVKPPTGIPKSMLMPTPDGSYALPSGAVAVLRPNEAAFEKEIEGLPSTRPVSDLPPELRCPICKEVMKDAVLTSKCCFSSFCDKCIRDFIISKSMCVCGVTNVLADDLLPNKTLRETINRILESTTSSAENLGSCLQVQDMESARCPQLKVPSPTLSATTKEEQTQPPNGDTLNAKKVASEGNVVVSVPQQSLEKNRSTKNVDQSEATLESMSMKEPASQGSAPLAEEEVQQQLPVGEPGKKKKKKKARLPVNGFAAADMQWRMAQDLGAENCVMPFAPMAYNNPYLPGMQWGMDGYGAPFGSAVPYMGYNPSPFDVPFGGVLPQDPFAAQAYMLPGVPQRDYLEYGMNLNPAHQVMSREEFEARKADLRRKRQNERLSERECSMDRGVSNNADVPFLKSKPRLMSQAASVERAERAPSMEPRCEADPARLSPRASGKRKPERDDLPPAVDLKTDRKQKGSVFSRISFPDSGEGSKKRKPSEAMNGFKDHHELPHRPPGGGHAFHDERKLPKGVTGSSRRSVHEHDLSDEEFHFKRKRSRHEMDEWERDEEDGGRGSRDRERTREHERGRERDLEHERERERERSVRHK